MEDLFKGLDDTIEFGSSMRKEFTLKEGQSFLNHGAYGAVPSRIQMIQRRFKDEMEEHPDDWYRRNVYRYWQESQKAAADFLHCDVQDIVFVENATADLGVGGDLHNTDLMKHIFFGNSINTVLKSCRYKEGDIILYTTMTYIAISLTCERTSEIFESLGAKTDTLVLKFPIISEDEICEKYEEYLKANPKTKVAVIDHITSPAAVVMPVQRLVKLCHQHGVMVMIDGAHVPGQLPLNLNELGADFYTGNFHKWLYTPRGCAFLHVKREHHKWVKPLVTSWNHNMSLDLQFFLVATTDQTPYATVKYAIEFFNRIGGMERIINYTSKLATEGHEYLIKKLGVERLPIPKSMESPNMRVVILPDLPQYTPDLTVIEPTEEHLHLRISAQIYNTMEEIERLADCMLEIIEQSKQ